MTVASDGSLTWRQWTGVSCFPGVSVPQAPPAQDKCRLFRVLSQKKTHGLEDLGQLPGQASVLGSWGLRVLSAEMA